jgi:hypothetical protein
MMSNTIFPIAAEWLKAPFFPDWIYRCQEKKSNPSASRAFAKPG